MTKKLEKEMDILNVRWVGKYAMVCDVVFDSRTLSDVGVEASPPVKEAEVFFPIDCTLEPNEKGKIETAVLSYYYDV